jgi:Tol biopolymer transport system component
LEAVVATGANERYPALSPDNRWLAYTSDKSGREEVYLGRLDGTGDLEQVSTSGGVEPVWSRDGRELFYMTLDSDRQLVSARLTFTPAAAVVARTPLFSAGSYAGTNPHSNYDVSPNGDFAMVRTNPAVRIMVIQNLPALVRQLRGEGP